MLLVAYRCCAQLFLIVFFSLVNRASKKIGFLTTDNHADTFKEIIKGK